MTTDDTGKRPRVLVPPPRRHGARHSWWVLLAVVAVFLVAILALVLALR